MRPTQNASQPQLPNLNGAAKLTLPQLERHLFAAADYECNLGILFSQVC